jgi:hypothetical protein
LGDANSNYNSLQLSLTKRAGFLTATFAYTYSKALGDGGGAGDAYNENPEPECPFTCLISTAANPGLVNGSTTAVAGGTRTGGVVETWKQFDEVRSKSRLIVLLWGQCLASATALELESRRFGIEVSRSGCVK